MKVYDLINLKESAGITWSIGSPEPQIVDGEFVDDEQMYMVFVDPTPEPEDWTGAEIHFTRDGVYLGAMDLGMNDDHQRLLTTHSREIAQIFKDWYSQQPMYQEYKRKWMNKMMDYIIDELKEDIPKDHVLYLGAINLHEFFAALLKRFPSEQKFVKELDANKASRIFSEYITKGSDDVQYTWLTDRSIYDIDDIDNLRYDLKIPMNISQLHDDPDIREKLRKKQIKEASEKAEAWIQKMYAKYPKNPINHDQRAIAYDGGEKFVFFELEPSKSAKDAVELKWFQAYPQREGVGTKGLQQIIDDAKEDGITLTLFPWQHGRVSQASLMRFYKRVGFKPTAKGAKNMIWKP